MCGSFIDSRQSIIEALERMEKALRIEKRQNTIQGWKGLVCYLWTHGKKINSPTIFFLNGLDYNNGDKFED